MRHFAALALVLLAVSGISFSLTSVSSCQVLDNVTDTSYVLTSDLLGAPNPGVLVLTNACIRINSSNIVLDCDGFSITNNGTAGPTTGILLERANNVTVKNCPDISSYNNSVYLHQSNDSLITNNTAHNVSLNAFALVAGSNNTFDGNTAYNSTYGFSLSQASGNTLSGNLAYDLGYAGFYLSSSDSNLLTGNTVENGTAFAYGFYLSNAHQNNLTDNSANSNGEGFLLDSGSNVNLLTGNTANNNTNNGFDIAASSVNTLENNRADNNSGVGFNTFAGTFNLIDGNNASGNVNAGFALLLANNNSFDGNIASNSVRGFDIIFSNDNNFSGNSVSDTSSFGMALVSGSFGNILSGNNVTRASGNAIYTGDNNTFTDNIVSDSFEGISLGANNVLTGNIVSGIAAFGGFRLESASHNNVLSDNTVFNSNRGLEILYANNTTVTNMHLYNNTFEDFLTASNGDLAMSLSGLVFDGPSGGFVDYTNISIVDVLENGSTYFISHSANPGSAPNPDSISFANKFVTITNSTPGVSIDSINWSWQDSELASYNENNFELWKLSGGVWYLQNDTPDVSANTLSLTNLNNFSVFGIFDTASAITTCQNISASGTYVLANDLTGAGIDGAPNFAGTACIRISVPDVVLDCKGYSITGNSVVTTGILTEEPSANSLSGITVQNCMVSNYSQGITLINTSDSSFTNNTAFDNLFNGLNVHTGSTGNTFSGNTAFGNNENGFSMNSGSNGNTLSGNVAHDNDIDGFHSDTSHSNSYQNNTAYNNGDDGLQLHISSTNTVNGNYFHDNSYGIFVSSLSVDNILASNVITGNLYTGILLQSDGALIPDGTALSGNVVSGHESGVYLYQSNNTVLTGEHYFGNGADFTVEGNGSIVTLSGVVFDNPAGNFTDYTNISLSDTAEDIYVLDHAVQPAALPGGRASFANKFLFMGNTTGNESIDGATWHWLDSELSNTTNESKFELWKYNGTWSKLNATLDTSANTLSFGPIDSFSTFAILMGSALPPGGNGDGGNPPSEDPLSVSLNSTVDGNIVTVTSGGTPIEGANVLVDGLSVGLTNSSGQVEFPGCSDTIVLKAKKSGYQDAELTATLVQCPACLTDADCPVASQCSMNQCVPVPCACGTVSVHQCVSFQCCADTDCPSGQACVGNSCVQQFECTSDAGCADTKYCDIPAGQGGGSCKDVQAGACGQVRNHTFAPYGYECGTEPGCPSCPSGQSCLEHKCVAAAGEVSCPATGVVGGQLDCTAKTNGQPCALCDIQITDPSGKASSVKTGQDGAFRLPLTLEGTYKVALLQNGSVVKLVQVSALPRGGGEEKPPAGAGGDLLVPLLIILLLIAIGAFLYWRSRGKKG